MESKEIFAQRLVKLREDKGITQQTLADDLKITRQSLSLYEKAERTINIDLLVKIAKYFDVSADYLLGLNDNATTDTDVQAVCNYTGLTETAISFVQKIKDRGYIDVLNTVLTNWDMVLLIENINILIDVAKELNNDNSIDIDVLNEFVDISLNNSFMKIALFDTNEIKRNIYFLCYEKFEEKIGYYYYKCEKTLKTMLENILLGKNLKDINKMADKIYSMYVKQYEEVSNNGKHNPKEE